MHGGCIVILGSAMHNRQPRGVRPERYVSGHLEEPVDCGVIALLANASGGGGPLSRRLWGDFLYAGGLGSRFLRQAGAVRPSSQARRWKL
jgi:hypothetical protein